jgi:uncharacterized protein (TIGR02452 family)
MELKFRIKRHPRSGNKPAYQPTQWYNGPGVERKSGAEIMDIFNREMPGVLSSATVGNHGDQARVDAFKDALGKIKNEYPYKGIVENYPYTTPLQPVAKEPISVEVLEEDTLKAAQSLVNQGEKPLVLDMANAFRPGGGSKRGARAQEEELCRRSNLYTALLALSEGKKRFIEEKGAAYIPGVTVFKKGAGDHYAEMVPFFIDVLASAALDLNHERVGPGYEERTKDIIRSQLRVAVHHNHNTLLLSAFGCGAFKNNPNDVARFYKEVFTEEEFSGWFRAVYFAITPGENCETFKRVFPRDTILY